MSVVKVVELVGTSKESWQDAAEEAIGRHLSRSGTSRAWTSSIKRLTSKVARSPSIARVNVAFVVEHHSHLVGAGMTAASKDF